MSVLLSPLSESCSRYVRREFLKGTCECLERSELMTSPSADRDLLMHWASRRRLPSAPDLAMRSEPARSTRFSLPADREEKKKRCFRYCILSCFSENVSVVCVPEVRWPVEELNPATVMMRRAWERELCSFRFVHAVALFMWPRSNTCRVRGQWVDIYRFQLKWVYVGLYNNRASNHKTNLIKTLNCIITLHLI